VQLNQTVLIIGGLHHLSQRVVKQLWQKGYQPRLLLDPADLPTARSIFPQGLEFVIGSISAPPITAWQGVRAAIYCPVQIRQPELDAFVKCANQNLPNSTDRELFNFTESDLTAAWIAVNDGVMGGVSASGLTRVNQRTLFKGNVSVDRGGGFASIRTLNFNPPLDLSNYQGISLRVRGDGQRYKLILRPSEQWDGTSYAYSFDTSTNNFTNLRIPFSNLVPVQRAKTIKGAPPLDLSQISSLQIMISKFEYDGGMNPRFRPGEFELELCSIEAYGERVLPQVVVVAPVTDTEGNMAQPLAGSVRPYTLLQMGAVIDRPGGQGLDFSRTEAPIGSVSSPDLAELCVQILNIPEACQQIITVKEFGQIGVNAWSDLVGKAVGR
jgi:Complex I intermediate-associated protein 30 (CIA30)